MRGLPARGGEALSRAVVPVAPAAPGGGGFLAALRAALSGEGPAVLPLAASARSAVPAWVTADLTDGEDLPTDPVAAVVLTSGSTGAPRPVVLTASALLASAAATHDRLGGAGTWLLALPGHTVAGVMVVVRSLVAGTAPLVLDLADGFRHERFAETAARLHASPPAGRRYTALVPTQLGRLLDAGGSALDQLRRFDAVLVGGAALPGPLRQRAMDAGVAVVATYGMTETCGGCVYDGLPLPGVHVAVEPAPDGPAPDEPDPVGPAPDGPAAPATAGSDVPSGLGPEGRVLLSGPVLAAGYRTAGGGLDTARFDVGDRRRWLRTDDRGRLGRDEAGRPVLAVAGRLDDAVVSGGVTVSLGAVERALSSVPGVAAAVAVGLPDEEWGQRVAVVVEATPGRAPTESDVRSAVVGGLGRPATPSRLVVVPSLPMLGPGKPDRAAARRLVEGRRGGGGADGRPRDHHGGAGDSPGKES